FVFTGATRLSQPLSGLWMLAAALALLHSRDDLRRRWPLLAGAAFAMAILTRPMPGVMFVACTGLYVLVAAEWRGRRIATLAIGAMPVLFAGVALLLINAAQTGDAMESGY